MSSEVVKVDPNSPSEFYFLPPTTGPGFYLSTFLPFVSEENL